MMHKSTGSVAHFAPDSNARGLRCWPSSVPVLSTTALAGVPELITAAFGDKTMRRIARATLLDTRLIADTDAFMPHAFLADFVDVAERITGEGDFGLLVAPRLSIQNYGAYGRYITVADTLGDALRRGMTARRFHSSSDGLALDIASHTARISYRSAARGMEGYCHIATGSVGALLSICRSYLPPSWRPLTIELDLAKPPNFRAFEDAFDCPVHFDAPAPAVWFPVECLAAKRRAAPAGKTVTLQDVAAARRRLAYPPLPDIVCEQIRVQLVGGAVSIEETAAALNTSVRTLQRELERFGTSYRTLTSHVRTRRAAALLSETQRSITDIAVDLGYSSPQHFARAFRSINGESPIEYRKRLVKGNEIETRITVE